MSAVDKLFNKASKAEKLKERRKKLANLLIQEKKQYEVEMKELRLGKTYHELKGRVDELKEEKEERRKKVAEEKLYDHWRKNEPRLREVESDQQRKNIVVSWGDQREEKDEAQKTARDSERRLEHMMELENLKKIEEEHKKEQQRKEEQAQVAVELREQMLALRRRDEEDEMLRNEEQKLNEHQRQIEQVEEKRKRYEDMRRKKEFGRVLVRQYKQQLKKKSKAVQEALEFDLNILREIQQKAEEEQGQVTARKEKMKADAEFMQKVIDDQLRLEKAREAELDMMYHEEAQRQWQKREAEWERERMARERLMNDVLEERQQQIAEKMDRVRQQQEESLEERERLVMEMEEQQQLTHREKEESENMKKRREEEIRSQITSRETARERSRRKELEELERKRLEEEEYEDMLQKEAEKITVRDAYATPPTTFRRRKVAFE